MKQKNPNQSIWRTSRNSDFCNLQWPEVNHLLLRETTLPSNLWRDMTTKTCFFLSGANLMHTFKVISPVPISEGSCLSWIRFLGTHHIPGRAGRSDRHSSACCRSGTLLSSWSACAPRGTSGTLWTAWHKSGTERRHLDHSAQSYHSASCMETNSKVI